MKELTIKEECFCQCFTAIGQNTYSNATASAEAAKYSSPNVAGWKLRHKPKIQARIRELMGEHLQRNNICADKVLNDLEHTRLAALVKKDLPSAIRCSELMGKYLALFTDRVVYDNEEQEELSEAEKAAARRLAGMCLAGKDLGLDQKTA